MSWTTRRSSTGPITATTGDATFADPELCWTGVLAAGEDAKITYQVRYTGAGDQQLDNSACVPEARLSTPPTLRSWSGSRAPA